MSDVFIQTGLSTAIDGLLSYNYENVETVVEGFAVGSWPCAVIAAMIAVTTVQADNKSNYKDRHCSTGLAPPPPPPSEIDCQNRELILPGPACRSSSGNPITKGTLTLMQRSGVHAWRQKPQTLGHMAARLNIFLCCFSSEARWIMAQASTCQAPARLSELRRYVDWSALMSRIVCRCGSNHHQLTVCRTHESSRGYVPSPRLSLFLWNIWAIINALVPPRHSDCVSIFSSAVKNLTGGYF